MEQIEDTSSQEAENIVQVATTTAKTKQAKTTKDAIPTPSNTLTRFLGPPGCPILSAWEDMNRQCPICQQKGFSSPALALHVNDCLDAAKTSAVDHGKSGGGGGGLQGHAEGAEGAPKPPETMAAITRKSTGDHRSSVSNGRSKRKGKAASRSSTVSAATAREVSDKDDNSVIRYNTAPAVGTSGERKDLRWTVMLYTPSHAAPLLVAAKKAVYCMYCIYDTFIGVQYLSRVHL